MTLDSLVVHDYPVFLAAAFLGAAAASWAARRELRAALRGSGRTWAAAGALCLLALGARLAVSPRHRVYLDELEHADIASRLASRGVFASALASGPGFDALRPPLWAGAFHGAAAPLVKALGPERGVYALNLLAGALTPLALFAFALACGFGEAAALAAAALLALSPAHAVWSRTGDVTVFSTLLLLLAFAGWAALSRAPSRRLAWAAGALTLLALQGRLENALLLPVVAACGLGRAKAARPAWAAALLGLLPPACIAWLNHGSGAPGFEFSAGAALSHLGTHLAGNAAWYLSLASHRATLLALVALGAVPAWRRGGAARLPAVWAAASLLFFCAYHLGAFSEPGSSRYALAVDAGLLPLAGLGALSFPWPAALLACASFWPRPALPLPPADFQESECAARALSALPDGVWTITYAPAQVAALTGRPAVSPHLLNEDAALAARLDGGSGFYLADDVWSRGRPEGAALEGYARAEAARCGKAVLWKLSSAARAPRAR